MTDRPKLTFEGEQFAVADKVGWFPLMRFARLAKEGVDTDEMEGMAAVYELLQECILPEDWKRFEAHATKVHAGEELLKVVGEAMSLISARPTSQPSDSSDGQPTMSGSSADGSGSPVTSLVERLEQQGRPSIAYMVEMAQASRASA